MKPTRLQPWYRAAQHPKKQTISESELTPGHCAQYLLRPSHRDRSKFWAFPQVPNQRL